MTTEQIENIAEQGAYKALFDAHDKRVDAALGILKNIKYNNSGDEYETQMVILHEHICSMKQLRFYDMPKKPL